jgi:hypothetical protein
MICDLRAFFNLEGHSEGSLLCSMPIELILNHPPSHFSLALSDIHFNIIL